MHDIWQYIHCEISVTMYLKFCHKTKLNWHFAYIKRVWMFVIVEEQIFIFITILRKLDHLYYLWHIKLAWSNIKTKWNKIRLPHNCIKFEENQSRHFWEISHDRRTEKRTHRWPLLMLYPLQWEQVVDDNTAIHDSIKVKVQKHRNNTFV